MDWITPDNFKKTFLDASDSTQAQSELAIAAAEDELVDLVGQSAVDDTKSATPSNQVRARRLVRAHSYLAIANHLPNTRRLKRQQDSASPASSGNITNEYFTPKELAAEADLWRQKAHTAAAAYILNEDDSKSGEICYSHPVIEGDCCKWN